MVLQSKHSASHLPSVPLVVWEAVWIAQFRIKAIKKKVRRSTDCESGAILRLDLEAGIEERILETSRTLGDH